MTATGTPDPFELFAIRYARHTGRRGSDNIIGGDLHEEGSDLEYFVWMARRSDRVFVIDTGFDTAAATQRGRTLLRKPKDALGLIGIDAAAVDHVILTHLHYDHAGTLSAFPRARLHVQDTEVSYATGRCMCHGFLRHPYDVEDVVTFVRRVYAGDVTFHDGTVQLADGLSLHRIGGHTGGLQVVRVWTRRGWVVVASDASHLYVNIRKRVAFPAVYHVGELLEGYGILHRLADSPDHIVPGHDPLVMKLYPALSPQLEDIVRLDHAPRPL
jgi:glyoxylase-like metal-dependent hydrolase (beta-lactamase superfamily II)